MRVIYKILYGSIVLNYRATRLRHGKKRDFKSRVKAQKLAPRDPALHPHANVDIRWDMTYESDGSYSANVTISNYVMDHEIEQPWKLAFIWVKRETLLSTLGTEGTQHGFVSVGKDDDDTYCLNNVTFVDLPRQTDPTLCIGGVMLPSLIKDDIAKSSTSFQISVSHFNSRGYRAHQPPSDATLTTRGFEYDRECDSMEQVIDAHLNTWKTRCILSIAKANEFEEIHEEL
ncbi:unnamed protein product [Eruca vesicaria subsp. sativa]|uniref:Uncharacterized protein n=1 Tax=Eruca vesicaria subsp. sativa TaxID=29727 RepID=A0ABC8K8G7_ERUVS|nr:unnamed protein product [Eruca vesicaria subsp. sativa]